MLLKLFNFSVYITNWGCSLHWMCLNILHSCMLSVSPWHDSLSKVSYYMKLFVCLYAWWLVLISHIPIYSFLSVTIQNLAHNSSFHYTTKTIPAVTVEVDPFILFFRKYHKLWHSVTTDIIFQLTEFNRENFVSLVFCLLRYYNLNCPCPFLLACEKEMSILECILYSMESKMNHFRRKYPVSFLHHLIPFANY